MNASATPKCYRLLVVDDNPAIHDDIRKILSGRQEVDQAFAEAKNRIFGHPAPIPHPSRFDLDSAYQGEEAETLVQEAARAGQPYSIAFVDVRMPPGWDGIETISHLWAAAPDLQIVLCTAYSDYSWEEIFQKLGKPDSLVILKKPFDNIEVTQIAHALTEKWQLTRHRRLQMQELDRLVEQRTAELKATCERLVREEADRARAEAAARQSEARFTMAFIASPMPLAIISIEDGQFVTANRAFQELTGFTERELLGRTPLALGLWSEPLTEPLDQPEARSWASFRNKPVNVHTKSDSLREVLLTMEVFEDHQAIYQLILAQDMTEMQRLQRQFVQAQKMEAVGQLAAGVAHDFNNILQVIQGYAGMLHEVEPLTETGRRHAQRILETTRRAASVVRQLLSFSRKSIIQLGPLRIQMILAAMQEILPRLLPENIVVVIPHPADLPTLLADESLIQQVLMNLAVNARDAMPGGGRLSISAEEVQAEDPEAVCDPGTGPGRYLCLTVADTGSGMSPEVLSRIFEPFFTTKELGKGTGLGLSMVYGIVKQHGGWITVESALHAGTTFKVFLPFELQGAGGALEDPLLAGPVSGKETILVVEDEPGLREFLVESLGRHGYRTVEAGSGPEALECWARHRGEIDLVVTDLGLPGGMSGHQLAERLRQEDPSAKIIYMSGYTEEVMGHNLSNLQNYRYFLKKPFELSQLLRLVRKALNETRWQLH
jgi:PAS domain S-box-containing protein